MDIPSKHIMIVLPHLLCGGTERTAAELANFIAGEGQKVSILLMYKKEIFYDLHQDVNIIEPSFNRKGLGRYFYIPLLIFFLRSQFKYQKPDIILAFGYIAFALFSSIGFKTKVIISFRSSPTRIRFPGNRALNATYKFAHNIMRKRVDGIIAQTFIAAEAYKKKYTCPVVTIPNFLRKITEYSSERLNHIITVGRCSREKGQHYLIEAFSILDAPDWNLIIVGDGPKRNELEKLASKLKIADRVIFTGFQKDVDYYLSQSKIFALTSEIEGFPNALIEAMANLLAPVSFNCVAGPSEIIQHGRNGFLVEVGNIKDLAYYLSRLIDNEELRNSISSNASNVKTVYSLHTLGMRYLDFMLSVLRT